MHRHLTRLLLVSAVMTWLTGCAQNRANTQVTLPETPTIPQLEKDIPVDVAVEGERDVPRAMFVRIPPPQELTEREKAILAAAEPEDEGVSDPLEFYVPQPMRPLGPAYFGPSVALQSVGPISMTAGSYYRTGVVGIGPGEAGHVSALGGTAAFRAAMYDRVPSVSAVGPEMPLLIDYGREKHISGHDRPRYRP